MTIRIVAIGKLKENYWREALAEYGKRLAAYCDLEILEVKEDPRDDVEKEGAALLAKIGDREHVIALEITGTPRSSEELATHLQDLMNSGAGGGVLTFIIGGSHGLSSAVLARADESLSFSRMTFPHQMMRVILAEQIYRSFKILRGEPYHK